MSKTLRIVAKDIRHLWPEILLSLAVTIAFVVIEPLSWRFHETTLPMASTLVNAVNVLLPLTWWLLIARVVQDESLVGDRQFWITRPYTWQRILAAKFIFVAAIIATPLFLAKSALLYRAGLPIWSSTSALLASVLFTAGIVFLAFFVLAAITSNLTRLFLAAIGLAVYIFIVASINSWVGFPDRFGPDTTPSWIIPLCIGIPVIVIFLQYAGRRTVLSRALLIAGLLFVSVYTSVNEHTWTPQRTYPNLFQNESSPITFATADGLSTSSDANTAEPHAEGRTIVMTSFQGEDNNIPVSEGRPKVVGISLPLTATMAPRHSIRIDHLVLSYTLPGQKTPYVEVRQPNRDYLPGEPFEPLTFSLKESELTAMRGQLLTVHLTFAVTENEALETTTSTASRSVFRIFENGVCLPQYTRAGQQCRFPMGAPQHSLVSAYLSDQPCDQPNTSGGIERAWVGEFTDGPLTLEFDPVHEESIDFSDDLYESESRIFRRVLCPGTPITVTRYRVSRRRTLQITLPPFDPSLYVRELGPARF